LRHPAKVETLACRRSGERIVAIVIVASAFGHPSRPATIDSATLGFFVVFSVPMTDPLHQAASPAARRDPARVRRWLLALALAVLALALIAVWLDDRNARLALRTEVAKRLADLDATDQVTRANLKEAQEGLREAQAKLTLLENRLAESQSQQAALEALYRELAPSRDEWALTEIEQVLQLASQQLQLARNVPSALAALQLADSKLQRLDRPQFLPLRRALARDMDRLKAVPYVDVAGISLRLDQAIAAADMLPLALEERLPPQPAPAPPAEEAGWRRFLRAVWQDIRQLIRVENLDRPEAPLLAPPQQFFLRENLKLRLLSARFSLLFHDQQNFRADLAAADASLRKYFDVRSPAVTSLQTLLKQLQTTDVVREVPDVVLSLEAIRALKLAREKPTR
jgi:uroporphyrin-3 C-methyltransferase